MEFVGNIKSIQKNISNNKYELTLEFEDASIIPELNKHHEEKMNVKIAKYRKRRSVDANALLWVCLGQMAEVLRTDKWSVYLKMLKDYGKYTYICVKPGVVEAVKEQWRECEVVGEYEVNGQKSIQMLCYFGSSTYNTKEFSRLLDGVIYEMREVGLQAPTSEEMKRALELWEKQNQ